MNATNIQQTPFTVLALLHRDQEAESLQKQMPDGYELADPSSYDPSHIDLGIIDCASWESAYAELLSIRQQQKPADVPIMLMGEADKLDQMPVDALQDVDQLLTTPISTKMLRLRLQDMGRKRRQSLQLAEQNRKLARFSKTVDVASSGIILTDYRRPDNPILYANETFCKLTGYDLEEIKGRNFQFLQGDVRDQQAKDRLRVSIKEGESCQVHLRNYTKSGHMFWNNLNIVPIRDGEGRVTHFIGMMNDVTSRVDTRQKLKRLSTIARHTQNGITITDRNKRIQWVNRAFEQMTGYEMVEVIGQKPGDILQGPDTSRKTMESMSEKLSAGEVFSNQLLNYRKDGTPFWNELEIRPIYDEKGTLQQWIGIMEDVTERKQTKDDIEQQRQLLSAIINQTDSIIYVKDQERRYKLVNESYLTLFDLEREEVIGKTDREIHGPKVDAAVKKNDMAVLDKGQTLEFEETIPVGDENKFYHTFKYPLTDVSGFENTLCGISTDITELKTLSAENEQLLEQERTLRAQAEEAQAVFKDMFEQAPSAVALLEGPDHQFRYANQAYKELIEHDDPVGKTVIELLPEVKEQGYIDLLDWVFNTGQVYEAEESELQIPGRGDEIKKKYLNFSYKPLFNEQNQTYGILTVAVDVTDQVELRKELERRLEEKTTLLAEIHHRVKNNLAVITGLLDMQKDSSDSEKVRDELNLANSRIQSIALVHEQLYQEAESDAQINLKMYLPKLIDSLQKVTATNDKDITTDVMANDIYIPLNQAVSVGLMVSELLINAFKHAFQERQKGNLQITAKNQEDTLQLQVSDDGVGLPEDFSMESGGMGMQIVSTLLEQLEADMTYDSQPDEGTAFTVQIPLEIES